MKGKNAKSTPHARAVAACQSKLLGGKIQVIQHPAPISMKASPKKGK